ncbi:sugar transferase, partial [Mycolicibacterium elephantis]
MTKIGTAPGAPWQQSYRLALIVTDVLVVALSLVAAQFVRLGAPDAMSDGAYFPVFSYYSLLSIVVAATWLALLAAYRTRSSRIVGAGVEEYRRVFSATLATVGVIAVGLMILRPEYARGYLAVALPLGLLALLLSRSLCRRILARKRRQGKCVQNV